MWHLQVQATSSAASTQVDQPKANRKSWSRHR